MSFSASAEIICPVRDGYHMPTKSSVLMSTQQPWTDAVGVCEFCGGGLMVNDKLRLWYWFVIREEP